MKYFTERYGNYHGKPKFPLIEKEYTETTDITLFFGASSWSFFKALNLDSSFLKKVSKTSVNVIVHLNELILVNM